MEGLDLSEFFQTKSQANDFLMSLSEISESIYEVGFDLEKELIKHLGIKKKDKFISLLRENKVNIYSNNELKPFLDKLQQAISNLSILSLVIAFEPTEDTLKMLSEWLFMSIHKEAILDITVDPKIIGGATVSFNGKYTDHSIKTRFDQIFQDSIMQATTNVNPQITHQSTEHMVVGR